MFGEGIPKVNQGLANHCADSSVDLGGRNLALEAVYRCRFPFLFKLTTTQPSRLDNRAKLRLISMMRPALLPSSATPSRHPARLLARII
jgi:hypothetical protein